MKMQCQFFRKQIRMMQVLKMPCWRQELPTDSTATMKGKNDQAIETLKAVIDEEPDRIDAYSMLIGVYVDAGKVKEAESIVQSGLERFVNQNSTVTDDQH